MDQKTQSKPSQLQIWLMASRPKTLAAAIAPVLIGTAIAYDRGVLHWPSATLALAGALLLQIGTNLANDYFDFIKGADTTERKGPLRVMQAGLVSAQAMKTAIVISFVFAAVVGLALAARAGMGVVWIGLVSILSGVLYTAGPYPLAYLGLGDIFVMIFFGPVAVAGTYYVQALEFQPDVAVAGLAPGLLSMAILAVNNLRDTSEDRRAGKKTLVVRFGTTFGKVEYFIAVLGAAFIPVWLYIRTNQHPFSIAAILIIIAALPAFRTVLKVNSQGQLGLQLNQTLAQTCQLLVIFSILFSLGLILP